MAVVNYSKKPTLAASLTTKTTSFIVSKVQSKNGSALSVIIQARMENCILLALLVKDYFQL